MELEYGWEYGELRLDKKERIEKVGVEVVGTTRTPMLEPEARRHEVTITNGVRERTD